MWDAQRSASIQAPDLPGFGSGKAPPPHPPTIEAYADFVHSLITALAEKPIVGGLSMGGYVLLALLRKYPADVAGAVLVDTRAEADTAEARAARLKAIEDVRAHGTAGLINAMLPRLLSAQASEALKGRVRGIMERQSPAAVVAAQTAMAQRPDQTDLLPTIKIPTLIIVGQQDIMTPPAVARSMHERIPGSKLVEIAGAGHMSPMEEPGPVNAALMEFMAGF